MQRSEIRERPWNRPGLRRACHRAPRRADPLAPSGLPGFEFQTAWTQLRNLAAHFARVSACWFGLSFRGRRECRAPDAPAAARAGV